MSSAYRVEAPSREDVDRTPGISVLEFGTDWCSFCEAAQPHIRKAFADFPEVPHRKVEDGRGRPLGRSFAVRLWPTLVFLSDGKEVARVIRPRDAETVSRALAALQATARSGG